MLFVSLISASLRSTGPCVIVERQYPNFQNEVSIGDNEAEGSVEGRKRGMSARFEPDRPTQESLLFFSYSWNFLMSIS